MEWQNQPQHSCTFLADPELTAAAPLWVGMLVRIVCRQWCNTLTACLFCGLRREEQLGWRMVPVGERKILATRVTAAMVQVQPATVNVGLVRLYLHGEMDSSGTLLGGSAH